MNTRTRPIQTIAERTHREKVVAEITYARLIDLANADEMVLSKDEAIRYLNESGHAQELWNRMMRAGEEYVRGTLLGRPRKPTTRAWALAHRQFQQV